MNTIRRSGSIFFTPLPISTTTFGFSTMVLRRLKSNLDPSLSSLSLGVLVPQPIFLIQAWGRSKWLNYCHKPNLHCRQMTSTNKPKTSFPPPGLPTSFYGNVFRGKLSRFFQQKNILFPLSPNCSLTLASLISVQVLMSKVWYCPNCGLVI